LRNYNLPDIESMARLYLNETDERNILLPLSIVIYKLKKYVELIHDANDKGIESDYLDIEVIVSKQIEVNHENFERLLQYWKATRSYAVEMVLKEYYYSFVESRNKFDLALIA
jgi:hypothetical protein